MQRGVLIICVSFNSSYRGFLYFSDTIGYLFYRLCLWVVFFFFFFFCTVLFLKSQSLQDPWANNLKAENGTFLTKSPKHVQHLDNDTNLTRLRAVPFLLPVFNHFNARPRVPMCKTSSPDTISQAHRDWHLNFHPGNCIKTHNQPRSFSRLIQD